jgi:hypothetical protein
MLLVVEKEEADIDDEVRSLDSESWVALNLAAIRVAGALVVGSSSLTECSTGSSFINFFSLDDKKKYLENKNLKNKVSNYLWPSMVRSLSRSLSLCALRLALLMPCGRLKMNREMMS